MKTPDAAFEKLKVLVIDDELHMRKVVKALLYAIGIRHVWEAPDGCAALDLICQQPPDVVILDWEMPYLSGPEFMRIVRSPGTFPYPQIPVVMLTGHGEKGRVIEAVNSGINEFLLKPVSAQNLADRLKSIVHKPRPFIRDGAYFGPLKRALKPQEYAPRDVVLVDV